VEDNQKSSHGRGGGPEGPTEKFKQWGAQAVMGVVVGDPALSSKKQDLRITAEMEFRAHRW
jgi:hypothetical protein